MSVTPREVKNKRDKDGMKTGRSGTVYDVNFKYKGESGAFLPYAKRGFLTKSEAQKHENEMKAKLESNTNFRKAMQTDKNITVEEYLLSWVDEHYAGNQIKGSTYAGYKTTIRNQILPFIGQVKLKQLTSDMIDKMLKTVIKKWSNSTARYAQRILSVALEYALIYHHYIDQNPARSLLTKIGPANKTPDPYTVEQVQQLLGKVIGTKWEMLIILGGLYGMRRNECLGLTWDKFSSDMSEFLINEQLPFDLSRNAEYLGQLVVVKDNSIRPLPITQATAIFFERQRAKTQENKELRIALGLPYYENNLVICADDGRPLVPDRVSADFGYLLKHLEMPHIRFHDLRHSAATNMHELTGDFLTVASILGHSLKNMGISLGITGNLDITTRRYVDVRNTRKAEVLRTYHQAVMKRNNEPEPER
jgi:integrase